MFLLIKLIDEMKKRSERVSVILTRDMGPDSEGVSHHIYTLEYMCHHYNFYIFNYIWFSNYILCQFHRVMLDHQALPVQKDCQWV